MMSGLPKVLVVCRMLVLPAGALFAPSTPRLPTWSRVRPSRCCAAADDFEDLSGDGGVRMRRLTPAQAGGQAALERTHATLHFRATLADGTVLSTSRAGGTGEPLELRVGVQPSEAVPGWDMALPRMREGERALLVCEARYAFGEAGAPPLVPPGADVHFELELLSVRDLLSSNNTETVDFIDKYAPLPRSCLEAASNVPPTLPGAFPGRSVLWIIHRYAHLMKDEAVKKMEDEEELASQVPLPSTLSLSLSLSLAPSLSHTHSASLSLPLSLRAATST